MIDNLQADKKLTFMKWFFKSLKAEWAINILCLYIRFDTNHFLIFRLTNVIMRIRLKFEIK